MRKALLFCAVLLSLFASGTVVAAEWSVEPSISLREEYNDNIHFNPQPHSGVWMTRISPKAKLNGKTEVSEISGSAQLNLNRFVGEQGLDRNDKLFSLLASYMSERNTWSMMTSYNQDSTSESETAKTGVVHQTRTQRSLLNVSPSWTRVLTERASLKLDYSYQDVKYDTHINLNDYTYQQAGSTLQYQLSERDQVTLSANYSVVEYAPVSSTVLFLVPPILSLGTDTLVSESNTGNVQAGVSHLFSETLRGSLSLGRRSTTSNAIHTCTSCYTLIGTPILTKETSGSGSSLNATLEKTFDTSKVSGFASRDLNASGSGLVETDKFGVSLNMRLTENLTGSFDGIAYRTKYINVTTSGSRYYTFEPKLNWRFTEWWTLDAGYRYARVEPVIVTNVATSNMVYINLGYNWPKMAISR